MDEYQGAWAVTYKDGTELQQWDGQHPQAVGGEVPLRVIDWPNVRQVHFESQWAGRNTFDFGGVPDGCRARLRMRTLRSMVATVRLMLLTIETADSDDAVPTKEQVLSAFYWLPDGSHHDCFNFQCPSILKFVQGALWGREGEPLPPQHDRVQAFPDAVLTPDA